MLNSWFFACLVWQDNFVMKAENYVLVMVGYILTNLNNDFVIDECLINWVNCFKSLYDIYLVKNKVN